MSELIGPPATWCAEVDVDDRAYVFVPTSGAFLALNETATRVWRRCDGTMTRDELVEALLAVHGGCREQVSAVVSTALQQLADAGLVSPPARRG